MCRYPALKVVFLALLLPAAACKGEEKKVEAAGKAPSKQVQWQKASAGKEAEAEPPAASVCPGIEAAEPSEFELSPEGSALLARVEKASSQAQSPPAVPEMEKSALAVEYYLLTEVFAATGYRVEALRKRLDRSETSGQAYVELTIHDGLPESAMLYDDMGNQVNMVSYLWSEEHELTGAVYKTANDRMLGMYVYCKGAKDLFVHDLSTFRVHAAFARKVVLSKEQISVAFVDGHDPAGELPMWPECAELAQAQEKAAPYQTPRGIHRQVFDFDAAGSLLSAAQYDLKGQLVEDLYGVARRTVIWADGRVAEKAVYSPQGLMVKHLFRYDDKGRTTHKAVVDTQGNPALDYFGAVAYEYEYDDQDRVTRETRKDVAGAAYEVHAFEYGIFDQVTNHRVLDGNGKVLTTYVHEFNNKGARTGLAVYDGDSAGGRLKTDYNGVAVYRFEYNDKGKMLKESRHGSRFAGSQDGVSEDWLVNGLDGWAFIEHSYDSRGRSLEGTRRVRVDDQGKPVHEERLNSDGEVISYRLERPFPVRTVAQAMADRVQGQVGPGEYMGHEEAPEEAADRSSGSEDRGRYDGRLEKVAGRYGDIRLAYFPRDARVTIVQRTFCFDNPDDTSAEECAQPLEISNMSQELNEDEELPYLAIENLPVSERGMLCLADRGFYPESQQFCPGHSDCLEKARDGEKSEECMRNALASVQYCPEDGRYYVEDDPEIMTCPDGKTLMDPARVPTFVFRYDFLFESEGFIPQVVSYTENDWHHLGSGKYAILFPKDFALPRAWGPVREKYASARRQMRCWRRHWEGAWEDVKRKKVLGLVREKGAEASRKKEEKVRILRQKRDQFVRTLAAVDIVRKVKRIATIRNGAAEIFWYCPEPGKCDSVKMQEFITSSGKQNLAELDDFEKGVHYGILAAMKSTAGKWDGMEEYLAVHPVTAAGLTCLQEWVVRQKEGQFIPAKGKDCLGALATTKGADTHAYNAFQTMFVAPTLSQLVELGNKADMDNYLRSVDEYEGAEEYEDLVNRIEGKGEFLEYLVFALLYDYDAFNDALTRFAKSRLVNYRRDAEKRGVIPSDAFRGIKEAMELAWWTGSRVAFDEWYYKLWAQDVQGCLLFARENDRERYERDLAKFAEMLGTEKKGMREQARGLKDFLTSLRAFAQVRPALKEANALSRRDRTAFHSRYPEPVMERLKTESPDLYWGLLYLSNPQAAKDYFTELSTLPEVQSFETPKKEGDQEYFHKYLAYMDSLAPEKLQKGMEVLRKRMEPMFLTERDYELRRKGKPDMLGYRQAIRDIVDNDIHLKYFWLVKLTDSPAVFDREFARLELSKAMEVARWSDPGRYVYLADLVWLKEMVSRYGDSVPMLTAALAVDPDLYEVQLKKLRAWSIAKSKSVKKYRRGKRFAASLLKEPHNVNKAMKKALKMADRYALLAGNLEDYEEAVRSTHMANAMEELRDEFDSGQRESYATHVEMTNEKIRLSAGFTKKEWEDLTKELEMEPAHAKWYSALSESLAERRLDCRSVSYPKPDDFEKWLEEGR